LVARSICQHSHRSGKPFIAVNCAAIPDNLIESELFGHEKGSFTGATTQRQGKFELCDGGTIFLDEIGDMALATQTKILRVLQQGEIQRVGGTNTIKVDVRIIAATNKNLEEMVEEKEFREDLYYRLNVVRIKMPPLRDRSDDIPQIVDFCLQNLVKQRKTRVAKVSPETLEILSRHPWPGNVRELENVIYRSAVIAQGDAILPKDLPAEILASVGDTVGASEGDGEGGEPRARTAPPFAAEKTSGTGQLTMAQALDFVHAELSETDAPILDRLEEEMIRRVWQAVGGNQARAAEKLGMTRTTLRKRIEAYGLKD
jgi:two-component system nitrogen regulation response regulator GlnG